MKVVNELLTVLLRLSLIAVIFVFIFILLKETL